jgi:hypothetical protein
MNAFGKKAALVPTFSEISMPIEVRAAAKIAALVSSSIVISVNAGSDSSARNETRQ